MGTPHKLAKTNADLILELIAELHLKGVLSDNEYTLWYKKWREINDNSTE